jgi:hypothetical protein
MLVALTVRRLKPGAFDDFRRAWQLDSPPPGWTRALTARKVDDEREVVSFGFFDGTLEELRRSQQEFGYAEQRAAVDATVDADLADGIYEVAIDLQA